MTTQTDKPAWTGWFRCRLGAPWRVVCQGESEAEVWDLLAAVVRESGDTVALPSHRHPDQKTRLQRSERGHGPLMHGNGLLRG
jgi:hypothetical protein